MEHNGVLIHKVGQKRQGEKIWLITTLSNKITETVFFLCNLSNTYLPNKYTQITLALLLYTKQCRREHRGHSHLSFQQSAINSVSYLGSAHCTEAIHQDMPTFTWRVIGW